MKKFKIEELNPILKKKLCVWDRYKGKHIPGYEALLLFVFSNGVENYFKCIEEAELIDKIANFGRPSQERHKYVLLEKNEVKSYVCFTVEKEEGKKTRMYIDSIASHPLEHGKGYATKLLKTIIKNSDKYMSVKPAYVYGLVKKNNLSSQALFQKLGEVEYEQAEHEDYFFNIVKTKYYDELGKK